MKKVWVNGCFDLLHEGHLDFLKEAKSQGDYLIVGLNSDSSVKQNKGPKRPVENEEIRKRKLMKTLIVDEVIIYNDLTPIEIIKKINPDVIVRGHDQKIEEELNAFKFYRAGKQKDISTTKLIQNQK